MAALTVNTDRRVSGGAFSRHPLLASARPFQGSLLGGSDGYARALTAGDKFLGICRNRPAAAPAASGGAEIEMTRGSFYFRAAAITGVSTGIAAIGTKVYAASDNDLTATASGNSFVGTISGYDATNGYEIYATTQEVLAAAS